MDEKTKEATFELIENEITALMDVRIGWGVLPREDVGEYYQLDREALRVIKAALKDYEKVKADTELDKMLMADLTKDMNEYHDKAEKAEAELEKVKAAHITDLEHIKVRDDSFGVLLDSNIRLEEELARWRPLIEAVEGADKNLLAESINNLEFLLEKFTTAYYGAGQDLAILRAALACREEKKCGA